MALTPIPQNYRNNVDWILGAYTDAGVTFPNGFQKDAIQNAVGARKTNKWKNWRCDISLIENAHGKYVVVEDSGTVGLTGANFQQKNVCHVLHLCLTLAATQLAVAFLVQEKVFIPSLLSLILTIMTLYEKMVYM